jgi:hypothetical protein
MHFINSKQSRKGQSLVEAMIAISVLTVGFLGLIALLSKSFFYSREVSDKMRATYLASEGIEIVKNLVDHDMTVSSESGGLEGGWGSCFTGYGSHDFEMDYTTADCTSLHSYSAPGDPLLFDSATHLYGYENSANTAPTNFTRDIRIVPNGDEIIVQSIVNWSTGPITSQNVIMEDHFYDWQPK